MIIKYRRYVAYHGIGDTPPTVGIVNCWVTDPMPHDIEQRPWFVRWIDLTWITEEVERPSL